MNTRQVAAPPSERQFMAAVIEYATLVGWRVYHTHDARRSAAGFPDLTLVRNDRLAFVELKTEKGRVRPAQAEWLAALERCGACDVHVWRPADWPAIEATLR
jgi:VRR-NUC domain